MTEIAVPQKGYWVWAGQRFGGCPACGKGGLYQDGGLVRCKWCHQTFTRAALQVEMDSVRVALRALQTLRTEWPRRAEWLPRWMAAYRAWVVPVGEWGG